MANRKRAKAKEQPAPAVRPENWPTPELERNLTRQRFEGEITAAIEVINRKTAAGRDRESEGIRIVSQIEMMHRQGRLTSEEVQAAQDFYKDFILGHRVGGLTSRYGEMTAYGGTPLSQQARDSDKMTPEELRAHHQARFVKACLKIYEVVPTMRVVDRAVRLLCEVRLADEQRLVSLRDVGEYMGYLQSQQQQASGATYIQVILRALAVHYGRAKLERPRQNQFLSLEGT